MRIGKKYPQSLIQADIWEKIYETTIEASTTTITISDLTGNTDDMYKIFTYFVNDYGGAANYFIRFNGDSANNYGFQQYYGLDTTMTATQDTSENNWRIGENVNQNEVSIGECVVFAKAQGAGFERIGKTFWSRGVSGTHTTETNRRGHVWNNTADEITSMTINADQTNGIGVDSYIVIYKKVST